MESDNYVGYVLQTDEDIEGFFSFFSIPPAFRKVLIENSSYKIRAYAPDDIVTLFLGLHSDFPDTKTMAFWGQKYQLLYKNITRSKTIDAPEEALLSWIDSEYQLFQALEEKIYRSTYTTPFPSSNALIEFANKILNRRKSRAGKSLEHHLNRVFRCASLRFGIQVCTEGNKRPDFIFPSEVDYHDSLFPSEQLVFLGAKRLVKIVGDKSLTRQTELTTNTFLLYKKVFPRGSLRK